MARHDKQIKNLARAIADTGHNAALVEELQEILRRSLRSPHGRQRRRGSLSLGGWPGVTRHCLQLEGIFPIRNKCLLCISLRPPHNEVVATQSRRTD